ncbi:hypothetical protein CI437_002752 [Salmonella enterica subsp. enterica serovar Berta]|uniref:Ig-like domain-containing protein n=2 Tax=Salmonella enterica TaxID=28901 RepID=UPI00094ECFDB|nr:hypothetical protein [Salmonella enterica]EAA5829644.1 hypothetical protein [Salmonella enterica subsp. enterica serovar Berta]EBM9788043.1 hypothetical protein [Salmonella enterica subsp. enterica serovar Enteritidis]EBP3840364.1 hypothetical protein [Salmonella enterica subsp. enterica]ECW6747885.1 hypothetical protein [Salmonella enterica subsp. enterica serovar Dublin]
MQRNLPHIISQATSAPLLLEPAYARVFFCALGRESGINSLHIPGNNESLDQSDMALVTGNFMATGKPQARFYQVVNGIAVLPVTGTLVHKLGGMRPFSGMTGYDGITARLQQAVSDPEVKGILLDIDSPGGQAAGAFDCADMIYRMREHKPVWALANETACSAASATVAAGATTTLTFTVKPDNASDKTLQVATADPLIATVTLKDNVATVKGVKAGSVNIVGISSDGSLVAVAAVTVTAS